MTDHLHPITRTEWMGFQGAETYEDGDLPLFGEVRPLNGSAGSEVLIVAGRDAIDIYTGEGPGEASYTRTFPSGIPGSLQRIVAQQAADLIFKGNPASVVASLFGFDCC
jgi:hypothetical protein